MFSKKKNEIVESKQQLMELLGAESLSVREFDQSVSEDKLTFPLADMFSLGAAISSLASVASGTNKLYEAVIPAGKTLAQAKDNSGLLGTLLDENNQIAGQARFREVKGTAQKAASASQMFMALAIMSINKSLEEVADNQKTIIAFLETDKQTQLKADLIVLSDIIREYQHNWNNQQFKANRENQVQDIKRNAEQSILFYREMVEHDFAKKKFVRLNTEKELEDVQRKFRYYRLALYLYSFSSFLDVMLLENFDATYLNSIAERVRNYSAEYECFHDKSAEGVEKLAETAVQARVLQGLSVAGGFLGKQIAKIPDKENRIKVDDFLIESSERMDQKQKLAIERTRDDFSASRKNEAMLFVEKIDLVNRLYNEPIRICFDSENVYLQTNFGA